MPARQDTSKEIPADKIARFNELITGQRWVNCYEGYEW
jgi:hypothetical protein